MKSKQITTILGCLALTFSLTQAQAPISVDLSQLYDTGNEIWRSDTVNGAPESFLTVLPLSAWYNNGENNLYVSGPNVEGSRNSVGLHVAFSGADGGQIQFTVDRDVRLDNFLVQSNARADDINLVFNINGNDYSVSSSDYNNFNPGTHSFSNTIKNLVITADSSFTLTSNNPQLRILAFKTLGFVTVPEPSTYAFLLGLGALGFAAYRRRRH